MNGYNYPIVPLPPRGSKEWEELVETNKKLKELAKQLNVPIFISHAPKPEKT